MTNFARIILRYGDDATVKKASGDTEVKCFIQPVMTKSRQTAWSEMTPLGEKDLSRYYGFFPPDAALEKGDGVICGNVEYEIERAEAYVVEKKTSHVETVMRRKEEKYDG